HRHDADDYLRHHHGEYHPESDQFRSIVGLALSFDRSTHHVPARRASVACLVGDSHFYRPHDGNHRRPGLGLRSHLSRGHPYVWQETHVAGTHEVDPVRLEELVIGKFGNWEIW